MVIKMFFLNKLAIKMIHWYQKGDDRPHRCRHIPTCSEYGLECYEKFNFIKASFLTGYRIIRCNPLNRKVYDPVPLSKKEKLKFKAALIEASIIDKDIIKISKEDFESEKTKLNQMICLIWENHFNKKDYIKKELINDDEIVLFYAKINRILYLVKKKQIALSYRFCKNYLDCYLLSNIYIHPNNFINNKKHPSLR